MQSFALKPFGRRHGLELGVETSRVDRVWRLQYRLAGATDGIPTRWFPDLVSLEEDTLSEIG